MQSKQARYSVSLFILSLLCLHSNTLFGDFGDPCKEFKKAYIHPDKVSVLENNIWVSHQGKWFTVPNLGSDAEGLYVTSSDQWEAYWTCPRCGQVNLFYDLVCRKCGH